MTVVMTIMTRPGVHVSPAAVHAKSFAHEAALHEAPDADCDAPDAAFEAPHADFEATDADHACSGRTVTLPTLAVPVPFPVRPKMVSLPYVLLFSCGPEPLSSRTSWFALFRPSSAFLLPFGLVRGGYST